MAEEEAAGGVHWLGCGGMSDVGVGVVVGWWGALNDGDPDLKRPT